MTLKKALKRRFGKKATRQMYAAAPWVGAAVTAALALRWRGVDKVSSDLRNIRSSVNNTVRRAKGAPADRERDLVGSY